jgi:predicted ArsR family transcriptional regulator
MVEIPPTAIDTLNTNLSESKLYSVASHKTRRRIMLIMLNGKLLSASEYRDIVRTDNPSAKGNSAPAVKNHFKRLERYGLIQQVTGQTEEGRIKKGALKIKLYKITETGKNIFNIANGLIKPKQEPNKIVFEVNQSG